MDMLPVDRTQAECLRLGTDHITILATCQQTGHAASPSRCECHLVAARRSCIAMRPARSTTYLRANSPFISVIQPVSVRRVTATSGMAVPLAGGTPHSIRNEAQTAQSLSSYMRRRKPMESFARAAAAVANTANRTWPWT